VDVVLYTRLGLRALYIGDEAVIDVPSFTLNGRHMRNVRQAVSCSRNAGVTTRMCREADIALQRSGAIEKPVSRAEISCPEAIA